MRRHFEIELKAKLLYFSVYFCTSINRATADLISKKRCRDDHSTIGRFHSNLLEFEDIHLNISHFLKSLIHSPLEFLRNNSIFGDYMNNATPSRCRISIHTTEKCLAECLKEFIRIHVWFEKGFAHSIHIARTGSSHNKIFGVYWSSNKIHSA
mmetsp:Transcript_4559/g.11751  ORF Transcript_4559/g.11751 Transcript_4559/m.11751 type:complete len:153 (+) Transcript_4559:161-619(+)